MKVTFFGITTVELRRLAKATIFDVSFFNPLLTHYIQDQAVPI